MKIGMATNRIIENRTLSSESVFFMLRRFLKFMSSSSSSSSTTATLATVVSVATSIPSNAKTPSVFFSASPLDRLHALRHNEEALKSRITDDAVFVAFTGVNPIVQMPSSKPLFIKGFSKRFNVNRIDDLPKTLVLLGEHMQTRETFIAVDVQKSKFELQPDEKAVDLRFVMSNLDDETAAILCHSKGMIGWHLNHQFCSKCGHGPTQILEGGMKRKCSSCDASHFPRTDPVAITLVYSGDRALLGRQAAWPAGRFSCLAGFVDVGETLEQAVAREVFEESGVVVRNVRYHLSQPWPNYSQIMLGTYCEAVSETITLNDKELEQAAWFTRDELRAALAKPLSNFFDKTDGTLSLPGRQATAHALIEGFVLGRHLTRPSM